MTIKFPGEEDPLQEHFKSREVFTDDTDVIGPKDEVEYLEALPISCAVITTANSKSQIAGMAHLSLGLEQEGVTSLIDELAQKLKTAGVEISSSSLRVLNAGNILSVEIKNGLEKHQVAVPQSEMIPMPGIKLNKKTGEVTFFNP
jgi:hypothetical protein